MAQAYLKSGDMVILDNLKPLLVVGDVFRHCSDGTPIVFVLMGDGTISWIDAARSCYARSWWTIVLKEDSQ